MTSSSDNAAAVQQWSFGKLFFGNLEEAHNLAGFMGDNVFQAPLLAFGEVNFPGAVGSLWGKQHPVNIFGQGVLPRY